MHAKPHRQNSNFQLRHFLAGSCSTPDGAYVLMYGQLIDMQDKLAHAESQLKRRQAKLKAAEAKEAEAKYMIDTEKRSEGSGLLHVVLKAEANLLEAEAERLEVEADVSTWDMNRTAAQQELQDIEKLMLELKPLCKHAHLPILEMSEAAQEEEWLGELKQRAENFLLTQGTIPHDHFQTMRMHPKFKTEIVPHIQLMNVKLQSIGQIDYSGKQTGHSTWADMMKTLEEPELAQRLLAAPTGESNG